MSAAIKVLIIDGPIHSSSNARQAIATDSTFQIIGEAGTGLDGINKAQALRPDLVLLDAHIEDMDGLETLTRLKAFQPDLCCIILTTSMAERDLLEAMKAGANGYLLHSLHADEVCAKLRKAMSGITVVQEALKEILIQSVIHKKPAADARAQVTLTRRENEILGYLTQQLTAKYIASLLGISISTVKTHIKHLLVKLDLSSPLSASAWAAQISMLRRMNCISLSPRSAHPSH